MAARSHDGRACSGPRFWLLLLGLLDDLPFLPTGTGPARCGRLQAPRGAPAAIGERFGQPSFVMRTLAMVVTSLRPDGWKRLTARHGSRSRQRGGLTSGRSAWSSIFDRASTQSDQIELANLWQTAVEGARPCNRPGAGPGLACWFWGGAPRRNRTGDPILTMEPPGTAVRTTVSPGHARPSGPKLSVLFPQSYAFSSSRQLPLEHAGS